jgi:hypothetical protein
VVRLLALMRLVMGSSLSPSQFFAQLFIIFWKKRGDRPRFRTLVFSLRTNWPNHCTIKSKFWEHASRWLHIVCEVRYHRTTMSSPLPLVVRNSWAADIEGTVRGWEQRSSDLFSLLDSKDQNQLNVSPSHSWGRSLMVISTLLEARGLGFESLGMHHFF